MSWEDILKDKTFPLPEGKPIIDILLEQYTTHIHMLKKMQNQFEQLKQHMSHGDPDTLERHFEQISGLMADVEGGSELWKERHEGIRTQLGRT